MFVDFANDPGACCRLCGADEGCTTLQPAWLSGSSSRVYTGAVRVGARTCGQWCVPGGYAMADCMAFDDQSFACDYFEAFNMSGSVLTHNLTFDQATFKPFPPTPSLFSVRPECEKPCPRLFPQSCG